MVKKYIALTLSGIFVLGGILVGCNQASSPVIPANGAVLKLSIPAAILNSKPHASVNATAKGVHASDAVPYPGQGRLKYCLTAPGEIPIKGSIDYANGSDVGTVTITLPKTGKWVVAAEWFYTYNPQAGVVSSSVKAQATSNLVAIPLFAGADVVDVEGTTSFTLNMEDIGNQEYACYYTGGYPPYYLGDNGYAICEASGTYSYYSFDQGQINDYGDVQAEFDATSGSEYLADGGNGYASFAYLGTGDLVNFATIPANATFYATTLAAKAAVVGQANEALAIYDVYVVKGTYVSSQDSNTGRAWIQVDENGPYYCPGTAPEQGGEFNFWFIFNGENLNYMKFDETNDGANNCNQNAG